MVSRCAENSPDGSPSLLNPKRGRKGQDLKRRVKTDAEQVSRNSQACMLRQIINLHGAKITCCKTLYISVHAVTVATATSNAGIPNAPALQLHRCSPTSKATPERSTTNVPGGSAKRLMTISENGTDFSSSERTHPNTNVSFAIALLSVLAVCIAMGDSSVSMTCLNI